MYILQNSFIKLVTILLLVSRNQIIRLYSRFTSLDKSTNGFLRYVLFIIPTALICSTGVHLSFSISWISPIIYDDEFHGAGFATLNHCFRIFISGQLFLGDLFL